MQLKKPESEEFCVFLVLAAQFVINFFCCCLAQLFFSLTLNRFVIMLVYLGILLFSDAILQKLLLRHAVLSEQSFNGEVAAGSKKM